MRGSPSVRPIVRVKLNVAPTKSEMGGVPLVFGEVNERTSIGNRGLSRAKTRKYRDRNQCRQYFHHDAIFASAPA
jgi:hypothetical protein